MENISVIIRCRNEENYIGFAIQSVIDHLENPEIIILDNNSTDDSMKIVSLFDRHNIKTYSISKNYTPGRSLNFGVNKASNNIILILSAHAQIINIDFEQVKTNLKDNVAVFGNQIPIYKGKKITKRYIWSHFHNNNETNMFSKIEQRYFLHNAFCFYKKETLIKYPYDETLSGKEDRYWAINMREQNKDYLYTGSLICNHYYTNNGATWKGLG
jgi:glycosyltransferase involved in cell wall biosynthesis